MEDAHSIISPMLECEESALFGVFDGHGGAFAGRYVATNFLSIFSDSLSKIPEDSLVDSENISQALIQTFLKIDQDLSKVLILWKS